jgi:hypothetical protein
MSEIIKHFLDNPDITSIPVRASNAIGFGISHYRKLY